MLDCSLVVAMRNEKLRKELLRMHTIDERTMNELAAEASLYDGYHPHMEAVHRSNAARLNQIIGEFGWPGRSLVGEAGMRAAWRIAQHAISEPALQRRALVLLTQAAAQGDAPFWQAAMLEDRICFLEGRPQVYGTQFDWDEDGQMSPWPIKDREHVEERRRAAGLRTLDEEIRERRAAVSRSNEKPPDDFRQRRRRQAEWARSAGWRR